MVKTRITDAGIIQEPGDGFEGLPFSVSTTTKTADTTLVANDAGVLILTASALGLTMSMPSVSSAAGRTFMFRSTCAATHRITASADAGNTFIYGAGGFLGSSGSNGNTLTTQAFVGASVAMISDGAHWIVLGASGSLTVGRV